MAGSYRSGCSLICGLRNKGKEEERNDAHVSQVQEQHCQGLSEDRTQIPFGSLRLLGDPSALLPVRLGVVHVAWMLDFTYKQHLQKWKAGRIIRIRSHGFQSLLAGRTQLREVQGHHPIQLEWCGSQQSLTGCELTREYPMTQPDKTRIVPVLRANRLVGSWLDYSAFFSDDRIGQVVAG
jgi:hypothetical protein